MLGLEEVVLGLEEVVLGLEVVVTGEEQVEDSSPSAAIANLFLVMTAALLETPSIPVGVPVPGYITSGLDQKLTTVYPVRGYDIIVLAPPSMK